MKLVLATRNRDKIREIKHLLEDLPITILTFADFGDFPEIEETGETLLENAVVKAKRIAQHTGHAALADDSGIEVDALNGAPGVFSSRYAGAQCTYDDNCRKLIKNMVGVIAGNRTARFRAVVAIAWDSDYIETAGGVVEGLITEEKCGAAGFGYDPIFYYPPAGKTFAEMTLEEKNAISHRGRALAGARKLIARRLSNQ